MSLASTTVFLLLLLISSWSVVAQPPPPRLSCTEELVLFSPCLPYVSAPPNNLTATANPQCCAVFSFSIDSGDAICLCYLLRQPMILGFPLDRSRVLSLPQMCTDWRSDESLESLCSPSESPELPPLQSIQFTTPSVSGDGRVSTSASPSVGLPVELPPETDAASPSSYPFSPEPVLRSPPPPPQSVSSGSLMLSGTTETPKTINVRFLSAITTSFLFYIAI